MIIGKAHQTNEHCDFTVTKINIYSTYDIKYKLLHITLVLWTLQQIRSQTGFSVITAFTRNGQKHSTGEPANAKRIVMQTDRPYYIVNLIFVRFNSGRQL